MIIRCPHCGKSLTEDREEINLEPRDIERFWKYVQKQENGCWLFAIGERYGRMTIRRRSQVAHIISWRIHRGAVPKGHVVMHNCPTGDNPRCVNPDHLKTGTQTENMQDMVQKGRCNAPRGERNNMAKFTADQVLYIRQSLHDKTETMNSLASKYKTSFQGIWRVAIGKAWAHVGGPLWPKKEKFYILTAETVAEIRATPRYYGITIDLAKKYGVSQSHISKILANDVWNGSKPGRPKQSSTPV